jgi:hypothetical protein
VIALRLVALDLEAVGEGLPSAAHLKPLAQRIRNVIGPWEEW